MEQGPASIVDETALRAVIERLRTDDSIVWVTGAGLSVASGINPYRQRSDAVWAHFITDWGTAARFSADPQAWYEKFWLAAHPSLHDDAAPIAPNPGHRALSTLLRSHPNHHVITQNIDGLHAESGAPRARLIEIHGRHDTFVCPSPRCALGGQPITGISLRGVSDGDLPECEVCGTVLRPLVLLFDEYYDSHPFFRAREARTWLDDAAVVAFVGTSFSVGITSMALHAARASGAAIVNLNLDPIELPGALNLLGPAEVTLPALVERLSLERGPRG
jgi:NAD-dependent deacetylase